MRTGTDVIVLPRVSAVESDLPSGERAGVACPCRGRAGDRGEPFPARKGTFEAIGARQSLPSGGGAPLFGSGSPCQRRATSRHGDGTASSRLGTPSVSVAR